MVALKAGGAPTAAGASSVVAAALCLAVLAGASGCRGTPTPESPPAPVTLRIGYGLAPGVGAENGIRQTARSFAVEGLMRTPTSGRIEPRLAERWSPSEDGLTWRLRLRPSLTFHSGNPVLARLVEALIKEQLPQLMGPAYADVADIRATSDRDIEFTLRQPSAFLMESVADVAVVEPGSSERGAIVSGTGPFRVVQQQGDEIEMRANDAYLDGPPSIDRLLIKPYESVRSAWADMLRGQVDVLYDVGVDAFDSLESSSDVKLFTFQRGYAFMLLLNIRRPALSEAGLRRQLNAAIDRPAIVRDILRGHGTPAAGAVWPGHWAHSPDLPQFPFAPRRVEGKRLGPRLTCIFGDRSFERLALAVQKQLQAIGVDLALELVTGADLLRRLRTGDFDAVLSDFPQGPSLARSYLFWHSDSPLNFGHFRSREVDAALDSIRHAVDDSSYRAGVAAFQRAIVDDPPAIFLAWRERARAVSRRFDVPVEPDTDILASLRLWRPAHAQTDRGN